MKTICRACIAAVLFYCGADFGQITTGTANVTVSYNGPIRQINLDTKQVTNGPARNASWSCFLACTTKTPNADLIFAPYLVTCSCPCLNRLAIGMNLPFYKARKGFSAMNLSVPLQLSDTNAFRKIDSTKQCMASVGCTMPYFDIIKDVPESVLVILTLGKKYALVRYKPYDTTVYNSVDCPGGYAIIIAGVTLTWYIQNNGTPDFRSVPYSGAIGYGPVLPALKSGGPGYHLAISRTIVHAKGIEAYSLKGERLNSEALRRINGAVIYRTIRDKE